MRHHSSLDRAFPALPTRPYFGRAREGNIPSEAVPPCFTDLAGGLGAVRGLTTPAGLEPEHLTGIDRHGMKQSCFS